MPQTAQISEAPEQQAPTTQESKVLGRRPLWKGGPIEIGIPKKARLRTAPDGMIYLQFPLRFKGGMVNVHLQNADLSKRGTRVRAMASIYEKALKGGEHYLYVDLNEVDEEEPLRLQLRVMDTQPEMGAGPDWKVFPTPKPLEWKGFIVVAPVGVFVSPKKGKPKAAPVEDFQKPRPNGRPVLKLAKGPKAKVAPGSDAQLQRLIERDGWAIQTRNGDGGITLWKYGKDGKRKTMTHFPPKK